MKTQVAVEDGRIVARCGSEEASFSVVRFGGGYYAQDLRGSGVAALRALRLALVALASQGDVYVPLGDTPAHRKLKRTLERLRATRYVEVWRI